MKSNKVLCLITILLALQSCASKDEVGLKDGDIVFQVSTSSQSNAIQLATGSKYSHVGIVYFNDGEYFVFEAISTVQLTPFREWVNRGVDSHFVVKRLASAEELLTQQALQKMKLIGEKYSGKNYDIHFAWSNEKIYCSELVWKLYDEALNVQIGDLQKFSELNLSEKEVREKLLERYGSQAPLNEPIISPGRMFNSEKLVTVYSN